MSHRPMSRTDKIRARLAAVPRGPWTVRPDHEDRDHAHVDSPDGEIARIEGEREGYDGSAEAAEEADRRLEAVPAFIAQCGGDDGDVAYLLSEVDRLRAIVADETCWLRSEPLDTFRRPAALDARAADLRAALGDALEQEASAAQETIAAQESKSGGSR